MSTENKSQKQMILEYMQRGGRINKYLAFQLFGCMTLAQRIKDIKDEIELGTIKNWDLHDNRIRKHKNASEYWMTMKVKRIGNRQRFETINMFENAECISAD